MSTLLLRAKIKAHYRMLEERVKLLHTSDALDVARRTGVGVAEAQALHLRQLDYVNLAQMSYTLLAEADRFDEECNRG